MELNKLLNIIGLITNTLGAFLMFYYTPKVDSNTYLYNEDEQPEINGNDGSRNKWIRNGMIMLFIGFIIQLIALFV